MKNVSIEDEIVKIFIDEIEAINNYDHDSEEAQIVRDILGQEKPTEKEIKNSNKLANLIINEEVKDALYKIAIEFSHNYKEVVNDNALNIDFLERIASEIRVYHIYFKLLNRVKRKEKNDTQTLTAYVNALKTIENITLNLNLKNEVQKELNFYTEIDKRFSKSKGFIHLLADSKLTKTKADKLELFIKAQISNLSTTRTNY